MILLVLLGGDIGSHVIAGLYAAPESDGTALSTQKEPGKHSHEDHSGCGNPEHGGFPGHHHHFPSILRPIHLSMSQAGRLQTAREPGATTPHVLLVARSVRAPPSD
ncbi:MAG: hypothetical protein A3H27_06900 [Acidobacteria bacterium RIFCSPLOWO2_02_FULL_59_13]|nr:MAG: hypothetical protein A3H27_06900 [Acidobacteria bacterium RIFCSPLOWO2_02_FULL_59_13]